MSMSPSTLSCRPGNDGTGWKYSAFDLSRLLSLQPLLVLAALGVAASEMVLTIVRILQMPGLFLIKLDRSVQPQNLCTYAVSASSSRASFLARSPFTSPKSAARYFGAFLRRGGILASEASLRHWSKTHFWNDSKNISSSLLTTFS